LYQGKKSFLETRCLPSLSQQPEKSLPSIAVASMIASSMTTDQFEHFYEGALTAGAILTGFNGTFLTFRIQREASYHRQPVTVFIEAADCGKGQDALIGLSRFNSSFFLIILGTVCSFAFGVLLPLVALANWDRVTHSPSLIFGGILASGVLVTGYFVDEMIHYRILLNWRKFRADVGQWKHEWIVVIATLVLAVLSFAFGCRALSK
jgi:hypothetical protein